MKCLAKNIFITFRKYELVSHGSNSQSEAVADPGGAAGVRPPTGPHSFVLTQIFRNVAASGVGAPPRGRRPPYGKSWICY